jgi:hypothetical protein
MKIRLSGSRVVSRRWTDREADMTELIVDFRYSANASKTPAGRGTDSRASGAEEYGALGGQTLEFNRPIPFFIF